MGARSVFLADTMLRLWWLKNNRVMAVLELAWPYTIIIVLVGLGTSYGSLENFKNSLGVTDPILYIFASSSVAFAAVGIIDNAASVAQWHRWLGTLPYIMTSPHKLSTYVIASGLSLSMLTLAMEFLVLLPGVLYFSGPEGIARMSLVLAFLLLGMLPLVAIGGIAAMASLMVREESNVMGFLNPLLLLLSGVFYPLKILPEILQLASKAVPVSYVVEAAKIAATFQEGLARDLFLVAYIIAAMILAYNIAGIATLGGFETIARRRGVTD